MFYIFSERWACHATHKRVGRTDGAVLFAVTLRHRRLRRGNQAFHFKNQRNGLFVLAGFAACAAAAASASAFACASSRAALIALSSFLIAILPLIVAFSSGVRDSRNFVSRLSPTNPPLTELISLIILQWHVFYMLTGKQLKDH